MVGPGGAGVRTGAGPSRSSGPGPQDRPVWAAAVGADAVDQLRTPQAEYEAWRDELPRVPGSRAATRWYTGVSRETRISTSNRSSDPRSHPIRQSESNKCVRSAYSQENRNGGPNVGQRLTGSPKSLPHNKLRMPKRFHRAGPARTRCSGRRLPRDPSAPDPAPSRNRIEAQGEDLRNRLNAQDEQRGLLRERMAHLEGLLEGLRETMTKRVA